MSLYYQAALVNTKNIQSLREAAATVQNAVEFDKNAEITYVPGTASQAPTLQLKPKINPTALGMGGAFMADSLAKAQKAINSLNGVLATVNPVLTGLGADDATRNEQIEAYLKLLSVDVGEAKKDNFFETIIKSIGEGLAAASDAVSDSTMDAQTQAKENAKGAPMTLDDTFTLGEVSDPVGDYGTIANTIIGFEGYRSEAYYDVNGFRTGFGSDTVTAEDGTVSSVTKDTVTDRVSAERDLARRINEEFVPDVISDIGQETWESLSPKAQAALTSIAYNYGSLPTKVAKAARSGDLDKLRESIENLQSHNGGINRNRRLKEASMIG
jgi:GH24 family phage-related lysozyme (muramidase)